MVKIENWSVVEGWRPEGYLHGKVYGHPNFPDGKVVTTSRIEASEGRVVTTYSRDYLLGEPDPAYVAEMAKRGITIDPVQPVKVHS